MFDSMNKTSEYIHAQKKTLMFVKYDKTQQKTQTNKKKHQNIFQFFMYKRFDDQL